MDKEVIIVLKGKDLLSVQAIEIVKKSLAFVEISFLYDSFIINHGALKSLAGKSNEYFSGWINKDKTEDIKLLDSTDKSITISFSKEVVTSASGDIKKIIDEQLEKNIHTGTIHIRINAVLFDTIFSEKIISLCTDLCEKLVISYGVVSFGYPQSNKQNFILPIEEMSYTYNNLGWINIFGNHHKSLLDTDKMLDLPAFKTIALQNNLVVVNSSVPQENFNDGYKDKIEDSLCNIYYHSLIKRIGADLRTMLKKHLEERLFLLGFLPNTAARMKLHNDRGGFQWTRIKNGIMLVVQFEMYKESTDFLIMLKTRPVDKPVRSNIYKVRFGKNNTTAHYLDDSYEAFDVYISRNMDTAISKDAKGMIELETNPKHVWTNASAAEFENNLKTIADIMEDKGMVWFNNVLNMICD